MPLGIIWEGPQSGLHSFAQVNRAFCLGLIERGHDLALIPTKSIDGGERIFSKQPLLDERFHRRPHRPVTAHVHHTWPPSFVPPAEGHWVIMQPWEFGSLPRSWIGPLCNEVDEVWAYTHYVRDCYIASGVPGERVHVVPLGVDTRLFSPSAAPARSRPGSRSSSSSSGERSTARGSTCCSRRTPMPSPPATRSAS